MYRIQNQIRVIDRIDHFTQKPADTAIDALYDGKLGDLILESLDMADLEAAYLENFDYYPVMILEAITAQASKLKHRMKAFTRALNQQLKAAGIEAGEADISKPRKSGAVAVQVAKIPLNDGQSVSLVFHAPDNDPMKINASDTLIAFRFLVNSRDVTHVVAPAGGRDVSLKQMALALSNIVERNAPKFAKAVQEKQAQQDELDQAKEQIDTLEAQAVAINDELSSLQEQDQAQAKKAATLQKQIDTQNEIQDDLRAQIAAKKAERDVKATADPAGEQDEATQPIIDDKAINKELKSLSKHFGDLKGLNDDYDDADEALDDDAFKIYDDYGKIRDQKLYDRRTKAIAAVQKKIDTVNDRIKSAFEAFLKAGGIEQQWDEAVENAQGHADAYNYQEMVEGLEDSGVDINELRGTAPVADQDELDRQRLLTQGRMAYQQEIESNLRNMTDLAPDVRKKMVLIADRILGTGKSLKRGEKVADQANRISEAFSVVESLQGETYASLDGRFSNRGEIIAFLKEKNISFNRRATRKELIETIVARRDGVYDAINRLYDLATTKGKVNKQYANGEALSLKDVEEAFGAMTAYRTGDVVLTKHKGESTIPAYDDQGEDYQLVEKYVDAIEKGDFPDLDSWSDNQVFSRYWQHASVTMQDTLAREGYQELVAEGLNSDVAMSILDVAPYLFFVNAVANEAELRGLPKLDDLASLKGKGRLALTNGSRFKAQGTIGGNDYFVMDYLTGERHGKDMNGADAVSLAKKLESQANEEKLNELFDDLKRGKSLEELANESAEASKGDINLDVTFDIEGIEVIASSFLTVGSTIHASRKLRDEALSRVAAFMNVSDYTTLKEWSDMEKWLLERRGQITEVSIADTPMHILTINNMANVITEKGLKQLRQKLSKDDRTVNLHWYGLRARPYDLGSVPDADSVAATIDSTEALTRFPDAGNDVRHGAVGYGRQLTEKEIGDFELVDLSQADVEASQSEVRAVAKEIMGDYLRDKQVESVIRDIFETLKHQVESNGFRSVFGKQIKEAPEFVERKENVPAYKRFLSALNQIDAKTFEEVATEMGFIRAESAPAHANVEDSLKRVAEVLGRLQEGVIALKDAKQSISLDIAPELPDTLGQSLLKANARSRMSRQWIAVITEWLKDAKFYDVNAPIVNVDGRNIDLNLLTYDIGDELGRFGDPLVAIAKDHPQKAIEFIDADTLGLSKEGREAVKAAIKGYFGTGAATDDLADEQPEVQPEAEAVTENSEETQHIESLQGMRDYQGEATIDKAEEFQDVIESAYAHFEQSGKLDEHNDLLEAAFARLVELQTEIAA